jgi:PadR family transcriptional regulator, regulatory protein PadR
MQRRIDDTDPRAPLPAGTLVMLILKTLSYGPLHGYAIAQEIKRASREVLHVEEGSLYPALQRALVKGWVTAKWVKVGPRREARVYSLTPAGRRQLATEVSDFTRAMDAIVGIIEPHGA